MGKSSIDAPRGNMFFLPPEDLVLVTDQDDPLFDERVRMPLPESLVRSVMVRGVIEPIIVRKDGDRIVVVDGRQRVRAALAANERLNKEGAELVRVPAIVRKGDDAEAASMMVLLNEIRFSDSVITKAKKAKRLADLGRSEGELAEIFGVSPSTIGNWLALLDLNPKVQSAVEQGSVRLNDAVRQIGKLPRAEQPAALAKLEVERPTRAARKASGEKTKRVVSPMARLKRFETFVDGGREPFPHELLMFTGWLRGEIADKDLAFRFPVLAGMFEKGKAAR